MAFNTGNPLGSTDPRDFSDNAENLDKAVNDTANPTFVDRLGSTRVTLANQLGYNFKGDYAPGIELTSYTDVIRYSGEFYGPAASATLPYTTTATLPDADANLVGRGDAVLRQELALDPADGLGAALVNGATIYVGSVPELEALPSPTSGQEAIVRGVPFRYDGTSWNLSAGYLTLESFGAVGDGVVDDTAAIQDAAASGKYIIGRNGSNYRITAGIYLADNTEFNLNGSALQFYVTGEERCLVLAGSDTRVHNGSVINNTAEAGLSADFQTPVMIGSLRDGLARRSCIVENLFVDTKQPNGRCIIGYGDLSNIVIRNIRAPSSTNIGRIVALHWGSLGVSPVTETFHVHNAIIDNIHCDGLFNASSDAGVIFLSAVYDVEVSNIYGKEVPDGYLVRVFCGDYGYQYAQTVTEQDLAGQGIKLTNLYGKCNEVVRAGMTNTGGDTIKEWPVSIDISGAGATGYGATDSGSYGIFLTECSKVHVSRSSFYDFYYGAFLSVRSGNITLSGNTFKNSVSSGVECRGAVTGSTEVIKIKENVFSGSGTYDVYMEYADDVMIEGNEFNSPLATRAVFADDTNKPTNVRVLNNHVIDCSGTPFVFGASTTVNCCILFNGNTLDDALTLNIKGGQESVPYALTAGRNSQVPQKAYFSDRAPTVEPSEVGDIAWNTAAAASGFAGWICVAAGSPGTWKTFGVISA